MPALVLLGILCPMGVSAVPIQDEFDKNQAGNHPGVFPRWQGTPPVNQDLYPNLSDGINEPHPLPAYVNRDIYTELLKVEPVDQVQSKVFNADRFNRMQRIGVLGFENKTFAPFEDKSAGDVVSKQVYQELKTNKNYSNIIPPQLMEDVRLKIVKSPGSPADQKLSGGEKITPLVSGDRVDVIMIGAVSKYTDRYIDRYGEIQRSLASGLEFTAFLVDPRTREVIWGARFVGSQRPGVQNLGQHKGRWLSKEDFTRSAMKFVLKEFRNRIEPHNTSKKLFNE
ncbi:MAG: hypothetical protein COW89_10160 [Nitrospinae bacterium CG22_combo_CG10-13_8_21_14_all_47_10]|nr:MAG: hypothetical protein COW89_10160 [Nitrospinae bacterium CG22_combo_CG10-13_8_21_14_all_47_10]